jgi:hypothetical protein
MVVRRSWVGGPPPGYPTLLAPAASSATGTSHFSSGAIIVGTAGFYLAPEAVLWIRTNFVRIRIRKFFSSDSVSDSDPFTNNLTRNLLKWCLSLLLYVFWNLYDREKSFPTEKPTFFPLSSVGSAIFHKFFYFTTVSGSESNPNFFRIRIQPKYSDYF